MRIPWIQDGVFHRFFSDRENVESFIVPLYAVDVEVPELASWTLKAWFQMPYNFRLLPSDDGGGCEGVCYEAPAGDIIGMDVKKNGTSILTATMEIPASETSTDAGGAFNFVSESDGYYIAKGSIMTVFVQNAAPTAGCTGLQLILRGFKVLA